MSLERRESQVVTENRRNTGMEQRRWTAPRLLGAMTTLLAVVWAAIGLGLVAVACVVGHGELGARVFIAAVMGPIGAFAARCAWRAPRGSVSVGRDGIDIVGLVRTRHVPLAEAEEFIVLRNGNPALALRRVRARRPYVLWVTSRGTLNLKLATARTRARLTQLCDDLNASLLVAKGAGGAAEDGPFT